MSRRGKMNRCNCQKPAHKCQCHKPGHSMTKPAEEIIYPVKNNVVHKCTEETVKHIHPSHTTVMNHHLVKNEHFYPHTTSVKNTYDAVDIYGNGGPMGPSQVAGSTAPGGWGFGGSGQQYGKPCCKKRPRRFW